jgi:hypothetical protein
MIARLMTKEEQLQELAHRIAKMKSQMEDTRYFIENALCYETQQIYLATLAMQAEELLKLTHLKKILLEDQPPL